MSDSLPPPVPKLDAGDLLDRVNATANVGFTLTGMATGGEVGAAFVAGPDGRAGVLSRAHGDIGTIRRTAGLLALASAQGMRCPRYDHIVDVGEGIAVIQERLPGHRPRQVDDRLVHALLDLNERCRDLLVDRGDVPQMNLYLTESGPGFCLHETLERFDRRTRVLLDLIREIGRAVGPTLPGADLVHADFHPGNILVDDEGAITGVVDWDGAGRGDRVFGLVTLRFDLGWGTAASEAYHGVTPESIARLDAAIAAADPGIVRAAWAHMSLRLVDWAIRHHTAREVDHYLAFAAAQEEFGLVV